MLLQSLSHPTARAVLSNLCRCAALVQYRLSKYSVSTGYSVKSCVGAALVAALPTLFEYSIAKTRSGRLLEPPLQNFNHGLWQRLCQLCWPNTYPFHDNTDPAIGSSSSVHHRSLAAPSPKYDCQNRRDNSIVHFLCISLLVCSMLLSVPAQAQQDKPGEEPASYSPEIEALPEPSPQPKAAPLKGQVEQFTEFAPNNPQPYYSPPPYQQSPDPFAGLLPQTPIPDDRTPAQTPARPAVPDLKGLLQTLMSMQGVQEQARSSAPPAVRPNWIPGYAYTNEYMVAPYHNLNVLWWDRQLLPRKPKWIKLSESVTKYWKGFVPDPCLVLITPLPEAPDNFSFKSPAHRGPSGWLQYTGEADRSGFPLYRYWFGRP